MLATFRRLAPLPAIFLALAALGCGPRRPTPDNEPPPTDPAYTDAQAAFLDGRYAEAIAGFERFIVGAGGSSYVGDAYYWIGVSRLGMDRYDQASSAFRTSAARSRTPAMRGLALKGLGDALLAQGHREEAYDTYTDLYDAGATGCREDELLHRLVRCARALGHWRDAERYTARLEAVYPKSPYLQRTLTAPGARERRFSVQIGAFSDRRRADRLAGQLVSGGQAAYVKVANRAGQILSCVRVGNFDERDGAESLARRLRAEGYQAIVVP